MAIVAFIKKKQKYDDTVKKAKDIEDDPTLSWLPISYRNSYAFSYISDCITSGRADTLKEALNDFEAYQKNLLLAASLKSSAFITEYFSSTRKSLIRLLNSPMRDSAFCGFTLHILVGAVWVLYGCCTGATVSF